MMSIDCRGEQTGQDSQQMSSTYVAQCSLALRYLTYWQYLSYPAHLSQVVEKEVREGLHLRSWRDWWLFRRPACPIRRRGEPDGTRSTSCRHACQRRSFANGRNGARCPPALH